MSLKNDNEKMSRILSGLICLLTAALPAIATAETTAEEVTQHYVEMAVERFGRTHDLARKLQQAIDDFVAAPSVKSHKRVKRAWLRAHKAYSQTEVYRFGNPNVDDWDGKINAWPLDEGLIDYVASGYLHEFGNPYAKWNIIASRMPLYGSIIEEISSGTDPKAGPQGMADFESNVAIGFHAIEFLLWGQDLNKQPGDAGQRSHTDYLLGDACTNGNCKRRGEYLKAASRILSRDLMLATNDWKTQNKSLYATRFLELPVEEQLGRMLQGMGEMSSGELAGERTRVALISSDQEEEQSCFSDTTQHAIYYNALGVQSLYLGSDESVSLSALVKQMDASLDEEMRSAFSRSMQRAEAVRDSSVPFDEMIQPENEKGRQQIKDLIAALKTQTMVMEKIQARIPELAAL